MEELDNLLGEKFEEFNPLKNYCERTGCVLGCAEKWERYGFMALRVSN